MKTNPSLHLIQHKQNKGYGAALISGLYSSRYSWIAFTDSDGQFDFSEITSFIEKQRETNADIVIGYYKKRKVPFYRLLNSWLWEFIVYRVFGLNVRDIDCGFKLIRKGVLDKIPRLEAQRGAFISTEFLVKANRFDFKIVEIPVTHHERKAGVATGSNIGVIISSFRDLFALRKKLNELR
jgi:glycosyltransferase involved in cell wall biosynthesis